MTLLLASATVRKRPQAFACGRRGCKVAVPWEKSQKRDFFDVSEAFRSCSHVVLRGRRGTSWHSFKTSPNSFCVAGAILLLHFQTMCCVFRGRRSTIPPMSFYVAGAAFSTCRVACFLRLALSALREVVTRCKFRGRLGILWHVMKIDGSLARNIDFDVANFPLHAKTRRKTLLFQVRSVKSAGSLVRNARFELSTCLVLMLWLCGGVPVPIGKAAKLVLFVRFKGCGNRVLRGRHGTS